MRQDMGPAVEQVGEPRISVVVATHRRPDKIERLLRALCAQTLSPSAFEVIVVDDCSGDNTMEVLASLAAQLPYKLRFLQTSANRGPGPARNLGWRASDTSFLAFTDDDCLPDRGWLEAGVRALRSDPAIGVVQGRTETEEREDMPKSRWNHRIFIGEPSPYFETCNIFYRRRALEEGGGFGEHYNWWGGWYCEDTYGGWRVVDQGWKRGYADDALVVHDLTVRSLRWWLDKSLVLCNEVGVAKVHPGFRKDAWWRPWSPRRWDAAFVLGSLGLLGSIRWKPAALLALPYIWWRRPSAREPAFARRCVETVAVDSARTAGIVYGAVRHRMFVV